MKQLLVLSAAVAVALSPQIEARASQSQPQRIATICPQRLHPDDCPALPVEGAPQTEGEIYVDRVEMSGAQGAAFEDALRVLPGDRPSLQQYDVAMRVLPDLPHVVFLFEEGGWLPIGDDGNFDAVVYYYFQEFYRQVEAAVRPGQMVKMVIIASTSPSGTRGGNFRLAWDRANPFLSIAEKLGFDSRNLTFINVEEDENYALTNHPEFYADLLARYPNYLMDSDVQLRNVFRRAVLISFFIDDQPDSRTPGDDSWACNEP